MPTYSSPGNGDVYVQSAAPSAGSGIFIDSDDSLAYALVNGTATQIGGTNVATGIAVYAHSTTITDYTTPTSAVFSSGGANPDIDFTEYADETASDATWPSTDETSLDIDLANDTLDWQVRTGVTQNHAIAMDMLGATVSDTAWVCRFKLTIDTVTQGNANPSQMCFGIFSATQATANAAQDGIYLEFTLNDTITRMRAGQCDGAAPLSGTFVNFTTALTATTHYVEIKRLTATSGSIQLFSDSTFATSVESQNISPPATVASLRYFKVIAFDNGGTSSTLNGTVDDVKFWNTVTTANEASLAIDGSTTTRAITNSEANANIYVDMGSNKNIAAVALHKNTGDTMTTYKLQTSTDASTWTDFRTITASNITASSYTYWRGNIDIARYVRVYGSNTAICAFNEIKVLIPTDAQVAVNAGYVSISATDTALDGDGV